MESSYNIWLVSLSVCIAIVASYTTLSLADRVQSTHGRAKNSWLLGGAFSMGAGIWAMHFIGMLAFHLPIPIAYDPLLTLASILPAFIASWIALYTIGSGKKTLNKLIGAGLIMGIGIAAMHYTGMAAMRMFPAIRYDPLLFWLSILIAIAASITALEIAFRLKIENTSEFLTAKKIGSAVVMGVAIAGMHYTGMASAYFAEGSVCMAATQGVNAELLATWVSGGSVLILSMTLLVSIYDARMADHNAVLVEKLKQANQALHKRAHHLAIQMTSELRTSAEKSRLLAAVVEQSSDAIITTDLNNRITSWNLAAEEMFGYTVEEIIASPIDRILNRDIDFDLTKESNHFESIAIKQDSLQFDAAISCAPLMDDNKRNVGSIYIIRDISSAKQSEQRLKQAAAVFESTKEGVMITDVNAIIIAVNRAFSSITGYTEDESIGQRAGFTKSGFHDKNFYQDMWESIQQQGFWEGEVIDRRKSGETYPKWLTISTVTNEQSQIINYVGVFNDITQLKETEQRLKHISQHDFLTNLPNRLLFEDRLDHALSRCHRDKSQLALLFLDLDRFKNINDSLGHVIGDHLLIEVAKRIDSLLREEDTLARLGGDEFIILLESLSNQCQAAAVAQKVITALENPFSVEGHELYISSSIGISTYPLDGIEPMQLLKNADTAMYKAKENGRGKFHYYSADLSSNLHQRMELEIALRKSLEQQEFILYFQPLVSVSDNRISGAEALVRWNHPNRGMIPPGDFLPVAAESGVLISLEEWILEEACRQLSHLISQGFPEFRLSVNLSSEIISFHKVADRIISLLKKETLKGSSLQLEITETSLVKHSELLVTNLEALKDFGVSIAIDDFGTGYSSMAYLKRFAIDKLKIDKSFVQDIALDPNDKAIVKAVIAMGHSLGFTITAEGVERKEQKEFLAMQGCDEIQGYFCSKPLPIDEFIHLLTTNGGYCPDHI